MSSGIAALLDLPDVLGTMSWADMADEADREKREAAKQVTRVCDVEENGQRYKVTTVFQEVMRRVPRAIAERKKWKKFGACTMDDPGPQASSTLLADFIELQFVRNRAGEHLLETKLPTLDSKNGDTIETGLRCRYCRSEEHWTVKCPNKELYIYLHEDVGVTATNDQQSAEGPNGAANSGGGGAAAASPAAGGYVAPGMRGRGGAPIGLGLGNERDRRPMYTIRVTNMPLEMEECHLINIFQTVAYVRRAYVARNKKTGHSKGFGFVSFSTEQDADVAAERFDGHKVEHVVLHVERVVD